MESYSESSCILNTFPMFSSSSFKISDFTLMTLIHFEFIFIQCEKQGSCFNLVHVDIPFYPAPFVKEIVTSSKYALDNFVESQMAVAMWVYLWVLYSITLVYVSVFVSVPNCLCSFGF
jgi:hypothetical protein